MLGVLVKIAFSETLRSPAIVVVAKLELPEILKVVADDKLLKIPAPLTLKFPVKLIPVVRDTVLLKITGSLKVASPFTIIPP